MVILQWPASPRIISDGWGWRVHPITGVRTFHWGVDLSLGCGALNRAAADGIVVWAGANGGEGNSVHVDHGDGFLTKYFHGSRLLVSKGDRVHRGQAVSVTGTTGASTGCHLHFEVWINGVNQNPRAILTGDDVVAPYEGGASAPAGSGSTPLPDRTDDDEVFSAEAQAWLTTTVRDQARAAVRDIPANLPSVVVAHLTDDDMSKLGGHMDADRKTVLNGIRRDARNVRLYSQDFGPAIRAIDWHSGAVETFDNLDELNFAVRVQAVSARVDDAAGAVAEPPVKLNQADWDRVMQLATQRKARALESPEQQLARLGYVPPVGDHELQPA